MHNSPTLTPRRRLLGALAALTVTVAACGGDDGGTVDAGDTSGEPVTAITVTSKNVEFDVTAFTVPVGEPVVVTHQNDDKNIPHNVHVKTGGDGPKTDVENGVVTQTLEFTIDEPGEYTYVCDVHPNMKGTITAVGTAGETGDDDAEEPAETGDTADTADTGDTEDTAGEG